MPVKRTQADADVKGDGGEDIPALRRNRLLREALLTEGVSCARNQYLPLDAEVTGGEWQLS